jgi:hypothetical protein
MNLLKYKNRFQGEDFPNGIECERNGYVKCLDDLLSYLKEKTKFDPSKRMIDSLDLLQAITDTGEALTENGLAQQKALLSTISKSSLSGGKVDKFLKDSLPASDPDDMKELYI